MDASHEWYRELPPDERSWVGLVAQAGIAAFVGWLADEDGTTPVTAEVFGTAPRELTAAITLRQTLDLIRSVVDVVEDEVDTLARPGDEQAVREGVLRYSRELAFAAAEVYARAAEARGAWDARLEALVIDAVLRGEADDSMQSRATALGWGSVSDVTVVAGRTPSGTATSVVEAIRRVAARRGVEVLAAVQRQRLVIVLGGTTQPDTVVTAIADHFGDGPIVVGPTVPHLFAAGRSARAALSGLAAAPAWPQAPRPVLADELLPERVLVGDEHARRQLVGRIDGPLRSHPALRLTAAVYLDTGGLEAAARVLFVHPNTVRYRLGRIAELTGYDLAHPRDAYAVRLALALALLGTVTAPARPALPRAADPSSSASAAGRGSSARGIRAGL
ncbi:MAG: helix-turn-helix domain-containing protein [Actinomycetales bacterium]|nr:helix-turn-helix domain-containing protein [Actinomycetales bacterium]